MENVGKEPQQQWGHGEGPFWLHFSGTAPFPLGSVFWHRNALFLCMEWFLSSKDLYSLIQVKSPRVLAEAERKQPYSIYWKYPACLKIS